VSGRQELYENVVNRSVWAVDGRPADGGQIGGDPASGDEPAEAATPGVGTGTSH
jgi:hypothetical protein